MSSNLYNPKSGLVLVGEVLQLGLIRFLGHDAVIYSYWLPSYQERSHNQWLLFYLYHSIVLDCGKTSEGWILTFKCTWRRWWRKGDGSNSMRNTGGNPRGNLKRLKPFLRAEWDSLRGWKGWKLRKLLRRKSLISKDGGSGQRRGASELESSGEDWKLTESES